MSDLAAIEARHRAATSGPWGVETHAPTLSRLVVSEDRTLVIDFGYVGNRTQNDAEFVAHAPEDIRALLGIVASVRDLRDDLREITGARYIADALDNILDPTDAATDDRGQP